jgi:16S rRNA (guanine527-N7)-methyltransferase
MNASAIDGALGALGTHLGRPVPDTCRAGLVELALLVNRWNAKMNLTGARTPIALVEVLFADALVLASVVPDAARVLDVGAGAGAPTLPLVMLRPDLTAQLLEPIHKRVAFMRSAIGALDLTSRARVHEGRIDPDRPTAPGGPFDVALSRATFAPDRWMQIGSELAPQVVVLASHAEAPDHDIVGSVVEYTLPGGAARWLALTESRHARGAGSRPIGS